ncbi:dihydroorotate dehydrogenase (quinone) [Candidatus Berkelbacteria bacterium RIFCSPLOWO2_01_FULL_50_28]|uniref:Dihydroorotate dehydrogenase (quinone) n=1 Tax=Candidatus Berkelbacteria bacterium RIFCSPLOWO2_01_FULL_50_28 TaxID=1797471 RepID=A0A1F5EC93_9BACT|nr:MAG: dihydroorotate dehydrogenase (quinone) [Candidatus Berkelbacteria bacterium RIFCSPHIGHO2_01_FULL_50_36]OGD65039.1 MAG: dihydroorotate dehydrogenase (quinone) [Candidatus Berkelbacteria bacterium RIFCSPLOWO2_01_FULL_50_28]
MSKSNFFAFSYHHILKPFFFLFDPESVHNRILTLGQSAGKFVFLRRVTRWAFFYAHPSLEQTICGINFTNPVGLAAGFDKEGILTDIMPEVGFGFMEIGSITGEPCPGNPRPRLWRLPKSKALVVYYGLKSSGAKAIARILSKKQFRFPVGISVAKTNSPATCDDIVGIADYVEAHRQTAEIGAYTTINISCPNTFGGQPFNDAARLEKLIAAIKQVPCSKPIFVKLPPDLSFDVVDRIIEICLAYKIDGVVCSNLTKDRNNPQVSSKLVEQNIPEHGGISGKVIEDLSNELIAHVYKQVGKQLIIIGCGGVFSAEDAYKKIKLGASLIQLITGMVFEGPQLIGQINRGLVKLLHRDDYSNISEAIGKAHQ